MRIFITGGTGMIGKFVVDKLLQQGHQLLVLTRKEMNYHKLTHVVSLNSLLSDALASSDKLYPRSKSDRGISLELIKNEKRLSYIKGSLEDLKPLKKPLERFKPDAAIHLAWEGIPDYGVVNSIRNLKYGLDLFNLLTQTSCKKIIAAGTLWEYGSQTGKVSESTPIIPFNVFTASKNSLNFLGRELAKENGLDFIWLRIFYVYGPGQKKTSLIPYLVNSIVKDQVPEIRNPDAENDFVYVEDVAEAICRFVDKNVKSGEYNIGSGKLTSINLIVKTIQKLLNKKVKIKKGQLAAVDKISALYADLELINQQTGWMPVTSINQGIKKTVESIIISGKTAKE